MTKFPVLFAFVLSLGLAGAAPVSSADLGTVPPIPMPRPVEAADPADFAKREAVLLLIRETFTLLDETDVMQQLASGAERRKAAGPSEADQVALDRALLAEGSYYLVSLRYLILAGGAAWPADRPVRAYEDDAIVKLDALQEQLFEAVARREDPLPVFLEAQKIWALTEGNNEVPEQMDLFGHRDQMIDILLGDPEVEQSST